MTTLGHISASYLLTQFAISLGYPLTPWEVQGIVIAGVIPDLDLFLSFLHPNAGDVHHRFPTHTPIGLFILWTAIVVFLWSHSSTFLLLLLISFFIHLCLDDLGFWLCRQGLQQISPYRQIQWLYPLERFTLNHYRASRSKIFHTYFSDARVSVILELILICSAIFVYAT